MTNRKQRSLSPEQLVRSINSFTDLVADYLVPDMLYVGNDTELYTKLCIRFPGFSQSHSYETGANIVVFDQFPEKLIKSGALSTESAYIFLSESSVESGSKVDVSLSKLNALTLTDRSIDAIDYHVRTILLLNDLSYANTERVFPMLLSLDISFRQSMVRTIDSAIKSSSFLCLSTCPSIPGNILEFIYQHAPDEIVPEQISITEFINIGNTYGHPVLIRPVIKKKSKLLILIDAFNRNEVAVQAFAVSDLTSNSIDSKLPVHEFGSIQHRGSDLQLMSYWCTCYLSHQSNSIRYYSDTAIKKAESQSGGDTRRFLDFLLSTRPHLVSANDTLSNIFSTYDRMSIDNIMSSVEIQVMDKLKERSVKVEAASNAAGIPIITFHKRSRRHRDNKTQIELHSAVSRS